MNRRSLSILAAAGVFAAATALVAWPRVSLWRAKRQVIKDFDAMQADTRAGLNAVLSPGVVDIPPVNCNSERVSCVSGGYRFSLPDAEYVYFGGPERSFENCKLTVGYLRVHSLTPEAPEKSAAGKTITDGVRDYFKSTEPYEILVDAFSAKPADIRQQGSFSALQKHVLLLLLKQELQPPGAERLWKRFEANGRKGMLAGDVACRWVKVQLYLPESRQFGTLAIFPRPGATMDDVYHCLGELHVEQQ